MSGRVGNLSPEQADALKIFKENVKDIIQPKNDDYFLLRFLRARKFDLKKTEDMFRNMIAWRKKYHVDTILKDYTPPDVLRKYVTGGFSGIDKDGFPVIVDPIGRADPKGLLRSAKKSDIIKTKIYQMEQVLKVCEEQTALHGKKKEQLIMISDLEKMGFGHLWKPAVDLCIEMITIIEDNYPETLKMAFFINAPAIFPLAWRLVKPFLSEETANKVQVFGSQNYKKTLREYIDRDQLPMAYGGTMVDANGDARCETKICQGGEIPKEFYSQPPDKCAMTSVVVKNRSLLELKFKITQLNSILSWEFQTDGYDIEFGVYKRTKEEEQSVSEMEVVVDHEKVTSHLYPEDGHVLCTTVGTYVVIFDNRYSMVRSKTLFYNIDVIEPDGGQQETGDEICHQTLL